MAGTSNTLSMTSLTLSIHNDHHASEKVHSDISAEVPPYRLVTIKLTCNYVFVIDHKKYDFQFKTKC